MRSQSAFGPVAMALALLVLVTVSGGDIPAAEVAQFQQGKGKSIGSGYRRLRGRPELAAAVARRR